ncbi:MAG: ribonuclease HII [Armatimonadetes bacterium]|nr:ribonuclease HII [Armatimonadota bacterium]
MVLEHVEGGIGLDEAGRGPLAGPVVAAAVLIPTGVVLKGLNDSKKLSPGQRESLEVQIKESCRWALGLCSPAEIDRFNILEASMEAMRRALAVLGQEGTVWIDGNRVPRGLVGTAVIKGDGKLACIAAASVLAKTERDRQMVAYAAEFPHYGFERNFGYPTPDHLEALGQHGPCALHRRSFAPVAAWDQATLF